MRVIVDPELCESNGVCVSIAPELFALGDDDLEPAQVLRAPVPDDWRERAERAARSCPKQAIRLEDVPPSR
jgi:ferredoxin